MDAPRPSTYLRLRAAAIECSFAVVALGGATVALLGGAPPMANLALWGSAAALILAALSHARWRRMAERVVGDGPATLSVSMSRIVQRLVQVRHRARRVHPLTGLPTRERLIEDMTADIGAGRGPMLLGAVRFADYDRLASFDPDGARLALARFATRLAEAAGSEHAVAQIDRDVIAIWFRIGESGPAAAKLRSLVHLAGLELTTGEGVLTPAVEAAGVTASGGEQDAGHLLARVQAALTRPEASFDVITVAEPVSPDHARERYRLEQDLARAIAEDQLTMVFQPIVDLARGRVVGAEALLRWDHPDLGPVSPARFVPVVEGMGLGDRYGLWVLDAACREARRWRDEGLTGLKVAVNLSARQLSDGQLVAKIDSALLKHGLPPEALELELTETAAMSEAGPPLELFAALHGRGVKLSIDDFGSGWSSLSYLRRLPFDKLKIDREFVTAVDLRHDSRAICKALIELGAGLGIQVLAEGVETAAEVGVLRELGCELFQGYFVSWPLGAEDFLSFVRDPAPVTRLLTPERRQSTAA